MDEREEGEVDTYKRVVFPALSRPAEWGQVKGSSMI
jgi:hypothetical protein